jgi:hypothetical protein
VVVEEFEKWCRKTQPEQIKRIGILIKNIYWTLYKSKIIALHKATFESLTKKIKR